MQGKGRVPSTGLDFSCQEEPECWYFNWGRKTKQCLLLSDYNEAVSNKFWHSGACTAPPPSSGLSCSEEEGTKYVFDWEDLIANEKTDSLAECLNWCQVDLELVTNNPMNFSPGDTRVPSPQLQRELEQLPPPVRLQE